MSWFAGVIDAGQENRNSLAEVADGLFLTAGARRAKLTKYWVQLVLASVIAAGGVVTNSTPAVIGAMIIAPLATPIYGLALAAVAGDRRALRDSLPAAGQRHRRQHPDRGADRSRDGVSACRWAPTRRSPGAPRRPSST